MEKESMQNRKPMILVFSRTKWLREKYNNNFFDKVGKYTNADYIAGMTDGYALEEYQKLRW